MSPGLYDSTSKHEFDALKDKVRRLEQEVDDAKRAVADARREAESAHNNLQLLIFAAASAVIVYSIASR